MLICYRLAHWTRSLELLYKSKRYKACFVYSPCRALCPLHPSSISWQQRRSFFSNQWRMNWVWFIEMGRWRGGWRERRRRGRGKRRGRRRIWQTLAGVVVVAATRLVEKLEKAFFFRIFSWRFERGGFLCFVAVGRSCCGCCCYILGGTKDVRHFNSVKSAC